MENVLYPPPFPSTLKRPISYGKKCVLLGLQCCLLMLATLIVYGMVYSREETNRTVAYQITEEWGGPVYFDGVVAASGSLSGWYVAPVDFNCDVSVNTQTLHRSVYEAEVYTSAIKVSGRFNKAKLQQELGDTLNFYLCMPADRIDKLNPLNIAGQEYDWSQSDDGLRVSLDIASLPDRVNFETSFDTRGSGGLYVAQAGDSNKISFNGKAGNPSFQGESLPIARSMSHESFDATWESQGQSKRHRPVISRYLKGEDTYDSTYYSDLATTPSTNYVGADFLVGVDRYQKVARSLKYSFVIILLTYIAVLAVEMVRKTRIPLLNYFLIGIALVIFYSLLLSFTELVAFWIAYLIAAVMTIGLISGYMGMNLNSRKVGGLIAILLTVYYGACYVMLSSSYALLLGSLLLFAALALLMYATLKVRPSP